MFKALLIILPLLISCMAGQATAQSDLKDCRRIAGVQDSVRHGFDGRPTISFDIDGDGLPDKITSRTYGVKLPRKPNRKSADVATESLWIKFDINLSSGRVINSFFKYRYAKRYGKYEEGYWVYAIVPCRIKAEKRINLFFYSGDDTSEEKIILLNRGNNFRVYSRKENGLGE